MPRFYSAVVKPSCNKMAAPEREKKGKPPAAPKSDGKKGADGEK